MGYGLESCNEDVSEMTPARPAALRAPRRLGACSEAQTDGRGRAACYMDAREGAVWFGVRKPGA